MELYKELFTTKRVTDLYAKSRPAMPEKCFDFIYKFCEEGGSGHHHDLAVDVGCGSGLSSVPLTKWYNKVIGVDVSQSQLANTPTDVPGLSFHVAAAENLSFIQSGTVNLVTAGIALHWFQTNRFYLELDRILKPGGSFAAYCHGSLLPEDNTELKNYILHIIYDVLGNHWNDGHRTVLVDEYQSLPIPYQDSQRIDDTMEMYWTLDQLTGYMGSLGLMGRYLKDNPGSNLMEEIRQRFCEICQIDRNAMNKKTLKLVAPMFIIMSRKPLE